MCGRPQGPPAPRACRGGPVLGRAGDGGGFHAHRAVERVIDTVADGLVCRVPARLALEGLFTWIDDALSVPDTVLLQALRALVEHAHVLVEPAGAAALAAAWARRGDLGGRRVVLVLTGANVMLSVLTAALSSPPLFEANGPS